MVADAYPIPKKPPRPESGDAILLSKSEVAPSPAAAPVANKYDITSSRIKAISSLLAS